MFTRRPGILVQGFLFTSEVKKKIQCYDFSKHRAIGVDIITGVMEGDVIRDYYDSATVTIPSILLKKKECGQTIDRTNCQGIRDRCIIL